MTDDPRRADSSEGGFPPTASGRGGQPARYETLVNAVDDGVYQLDTEGRFVAVNDAIVEETGYSREELLGEHASMVVAEADAEAMADDVRDLLREEVDDAATATREATIEAADGRTFPVEIRFAPLREDGEFAGTVGAARDLAHGREVEEQLRREREQYHAALSNLSDTVLITDDGGEFTYVCPNVHHIFGYSASEVEEMGNVRELLGRDLFDPDELHEAGELSNIERTVTDRNGEEHHLLVTVKSVSIGEGSVLYACRDVTERKERERELRSERDLVERLLEAVSVSVAVLDEDGGIVRANERAGERLGIQMRAGERYEVGDRDVYDEDGNFVPPEERPYVRVFETGEPVTDWQCQIDLPDRGRRWLSINAVPIPGDATGDVEQVVVTADDITRLKVQARQLRRQRDELASELDEVFERVDDAFFALDTEWRFTYVNDRAERLLDRSEDELLGENVWEAFEAAVDTTFYEKYHEAMETGESVTFEEYYPPLRTWFEVRAFPSETGLSVYFRDVTERKERERELERYETIVETTREGIYATDAEGRFTMANDAYLELTGYSREELLGTHTAEVIPGDEHDDVYRKRRELREGEREVGSREGHYEAPDGTRRAVETRFTALTDEDGEFRGTTGVVRDITERKRREQELRQERDRFTALFESIPEAVVHVRFEDGEPVIRNVNSEFEDVFGYSRRQLTGSSLNEYIVPEGFEDEAARIDDTTAALDRIEREVRRETADGEREFLFRGVPFEAEGDTVEGIGVYIDITERKERERELEQYRALTRAASDAIVTVDESSTIRSVNPAIEEILGYDPDDLVGEPLTVLMPDDLARDHVEALDAYLRTGERHVDWNYVELPGVHSDGHEVPLGVSFSKIEYEGRRFFTGILRDISDRRERERQLEEYETIVETIPDGVYVLDEDHRFALVNDAFCELTGYDREDLLGADAELVSTDQGHERGMRLREQLRAGERDVAVLEEAIPTAAGDVIDTEIRFVALHDEAGRFRGTAGVVRDISERLERKRELERYETLFEESTDVNAVIDPDGTFRYLTPSVEHVLGYDQDELVGENAFEYIHPEDREETMERFAETVEDAEGRPTAEYRFRHADGSWRWLEARGRNLLDDPQIDGIVAYTRDITERKERERKLARSEERYRTLAENFPNGGVGLYDRDLRYTLVTGTMWDDIEPDAEDLEGNTIHEALPPDTAADVEPLFRAALDGETDSVVSTLGGRIYQVWATPLRDADGEIYAGLSFALDITERRERERALEESERRHRTLAEYFPNGIVTLFDRDLEYTLAAGQAFDDIPVEPDDLVGRSFREAWDDDTADAIEPVFEAALEGEERSVEVAYEGREWIIHGVPITDEEGDVFAGMTMAQDITEQKERERYLREAKSRLEAATEAGAVGTWEWHIPDDEMVTGAEFARMFGVDPDAAREGVSLDEFVTAIHEDDRERVERKIEAAVESCGEYEAEYRVRNADDELRWVIARGHVECDEDGNAITFPGALVDITERKEAEQELERQREQLAALNELHGVVRGINEALVRQSTRGEIERVVCEQLAASDSYTFAWIGEVEPHGDAVRVRADARAGDYLADVDISIDPDDPTSRGPTAQALRTGEIQVVQDVLADPDYGPWREQAREHGFRSAAAIPIEYEGTVYGVLNVYADRENAFGSNEREVIGQLGEVVGHAINAIERKQALMSDEVVELDFQIQDVLSEFGLGDHEGGRITFDRAVPLGDDEFLEFGTATKDAVETLEALVELVPHFEDLTVLEEGANEVRHEVRLDGPPVLSEVAAHGGRVQQATIEDDNYRMTVEVPPSVSVRRITETVQDAYPGAEVLAQRQTTRQDQSPQRVHRALVEELTDRQRTALETAYFSGFFEWPRESTGEDIAEAMDIAPATFHQHLRAGEQKLLGALFTEEAAEG